MTDSSEPTTVDPEVKPMKTIGRVRPPRIHISYDVTAAKSPPPSKPQKAPYSERAKR
jgi:hypothetical protein